MTFFRIYNYICQWDSVSPLLDCLIFYASFHRYGPGIGSSFLWERAERSPSVYIAPDPAHSRFSTPQYVGFSCYIYIYILYFIIFFGEYLYSKLPTMNCEQIVYFLQNLKIWEKLVHWKSGLGLLFFGVSYPESDI